MTGNKKNIFSMFLVALILLPVLSSIVFATDLNTGTFCIDVNMRKPNSDEVYDAQIYLYKVASAEVDKTTNRLHFEPVELCKDLNFDDLTDEKTSSLLDELCKRVKYPGSVPETVPNLVPQEIRTPGEDGMIHFSNLDAGVYLLIKWAVEEPIELEMLPALVCVPRFDQESGAWNQTTMVSPKFDWQPKPTPDPITPPTEPEPTPTPNPPTPPTEPEPTPTPNPSTPPTEPEPKLPQTGMLQWPVPILVIVGLFLAAIGYGVIRHNQQS